MGELDDAATRAATSTSISSGSTGRELVGAIAASGREVDGNGGGKESVDGNSVVVDFIESPESGACR